VASITTLHVSDYYQARSQHSVTDHAPFAIVSPDILEFKHGSGKHRRRVLEIEPLSSRVLACFAGS